MNLNLISKKANYKYKAFDKLNAFKRTKWRILLFNNIQKFKVNNKERLIILREKHLFFITLKTHYIIVIHSK